MALGDSGRKVYDNTFYSRIRFTANGLRLTPQFSAGLLNWAVQEEKDNYKYEDLVKVSLSPMKVHLLKDALALFRKGLEERTLSPEKAYGVEAGIRETRTFIAFHVTGRMSSSNVPEYAVTVGKVDQDGTKHDVYEFVFNSDYHFSLEWDNLDRMEFKKNMNDYLELDVFTATLDEFINSASGATGYSVFDIGRYEINRMINPIFEKLGIERNGNSRGGSAGPGYFSNNSMNPPAGTSTSRSVDDLDDMV